MTSTPTPEPPPEPEPAPAAPATPADLVRQAEKLQERGEGDRALPLLMKAVELDPRHYAARRLLAILLAHDPALSHTAERHFLAALEQDPGDVELRYRLALYYKKAGVPTRAVLHLKLVLAKDPDHAAAWRELAEIEGSKGRPR
jgi:tetratricopeptide (TPR) repeat protein